MTGTPACAGDVVDLTSTVPPAGTLVADTVGCVAELANVEVNMLPLEPLMLTGEDWYVPVIVALSIPIVP